MTNVGIYNSDMIFWFTMCVFSPIVFYTLLQLISHFTIKSEPIYIIKEVKSKPVKSVKTKKSRAMPKTRDDVIDDGIEALKSLGYSKKEAVKKVNMACMRKKYRSVEELVQDVAMRSSVI